MFIDSYALPNQHAIETDVCIVGGGPAGISLARELRRSALRIGLLESGGFEFDERTQSLYTGKNTGIKTFDLDVNRLRFFGGTTNHWAGHCRPLDAIDFERRDWFPHSGWPFTRADLDPYYRRAQSICELGPYQYEDLEYWLEKTKLPKLDLDAARLKSVVYNQSTPTRFGSVYRQEIEDAPNISVYLNANVLEFKCDETGTRVTEARAACIDGPEFTVTARIFVMAAGGMENARLLFLSNQKHPNGLGNDNDMVGRFFMDHLLLRPGVDVSLSRPDIDLSLYRSSHQLAGFDGRMFSVLAPPEDLLRQERIKNFRIHLVGWPPTYSLPVGSIFSTLDTSTIPVENLPTDGKEPGSISLHVVLEPEPNPDSRITLSRTLDLFRQPKIEVDWRTKDTDLANAVRAVELVAMEFGRMGLGRGYSQIFRDPTRWPSNLEAGRHHCGTTRMSVSPRSGVVDGNCRVHGLRNLYIAGSSVFPTIGYANPTLTIVALALRLADHIKVQKYD